MKMKYSGQTGNFARATVKEMKEQIRMIGIKNRSKLRTRVQMIDALESFLYRTDNIVHFSIKPMDPSLPL